MLTIGQPDSTNIIAQLDMQNWALVLSVIVGSVFLASAIEHLVRRHRHLRQVSHELAALRVHIYRLDGSAPSVSRAVVETAEVSDLKIAVSAVMRQVRSASDGWQAIAERDRLTGLASPWLFQREVERQMQGSEPIGDAGVFLFIDIDGFKTVNDTQGHRIGDQLLRIAAHRIRSTCRSSERPLSSTSGTVDNVPATMGRLGGDEFALFFPGIFSNGDAQKIAARIERVLADPFEIDGRAIGVSASIGISVAPRDGSDYATLFQSADRAMAHAKRLGRSRVEFYSPTLDEASRSAARDEQELREALARSQFELYFQPLYDCNTLRIMSAEVLLRWHHPERGLILPGEFIPLAERLGLMEQIGEWVLVETVKRIRLFADQGFPLLVSVNVSPTQFRQSDFVSLVRFALEHSQADPSLLELEITESVAMQDIDVVSERLGLLAPLGVSLAIDDFGTGYSNLASVIRLPFSRLKLDRSLLQDLSTRPQAQTLVQTIISMANGLGLRSVAEGVETSDQLELVRAMGCDFVQGFLMSRPVCEADLLGLLWQDRAAQVPPYLTIAA